MLVSAGNVLAATTSQDWVAATSVLETPTISAFASVQASGLVGIASAEPGILAGLDILPGQNVAAGQVIARIGGPQLAAASVLADANLRAALAAQKTAGESLAAERQKLLAHLSTRQLVAQAQSGLISATSSVAAARASVDALQQSMILRSPVGGTVQSVTAANGDVLANGQIVASIQPRTGAWLKAVFYGDVADIGTGGLFTPDGGGSAVKVLLRGALGVAQSDGGMPVALSAVQPLLPGAFGVVTMDLPARMVTVIPSEALILDQGRWWVMRHDGTGDHPVAVSPGGAKGFDTVINSGLRPGDEVVVVDAYLLYNRGIAALYQPPD